MLQKTFNEQETLAIFLENCAEEGQDLSVYQHFLFAVIRRMFHKGLFFGAWQGSAYYQRFAGNAQHSMEPVTIVQAPPSQPAFAGPPSRPGPQPIQPGRPLPEMPLPSPARSLPPHAVPRAAPVWPSQDGMPPVAPTAPPGPPPGPVPPTPVSPAPAVPPPAPPPEPYVDSELPSRG